MVQDYHDFEIIIADDGSSGETRALINRFCEQHKRAHSRITITHVWHEDKGFRAAHIRNKAILKSQGAYIIFLDGDCFVQRHFITRHVKLAEKHYFVAGNRILCNQRLSSNLLRQRDGWQKSEAYWLKQWLFGRINRLSALCLLPAWQWRRWFKHRWKGAKTCNLGVFRDDLYRVNGFDQRFVGWGYEDSDLVIRLIRANIFHKSGRFYLPVFHLWHKLNDRKSQAQNQQYLQQTLNSDLTVAREGLSSYRD